MLEWVGGDLKVHINRFLEAQNEGKRKCVAAEGGESRG